MYIRVYVFSDLCCQPKTILFFEGVEIYLVTSSKACKLLITECQKLILKFKIFVRFYMFDKSKAMEREWIRCKKKFSNYLDQR